MGERTSLGGKFAEFAKNVVFGPLTEGVVEAVKRDSYDPHYWHILVRTKGGELKHFTDFDGVKIVTKDGRSEIKYMEMSASPKRGDSYKIRTRGTGVIHTPGSKIDKDPFNLIKSDSK